MQGTCKWFDSQKGYGFVADSNGKEVFVYYRNIIMEGFRQLDEGDIVTYDIRVAENGKDQAINVQPFLTMKMIKDSLKEENLYVKTMKEDHKVTKYLVVDANNVIRTDENGIDFLNLAAFAGFDTEDLSA